MPINHLHQIFGSVQIRQDSSVTVKEFIQVDGAITLLMLLIFLLSLCLIILVELQRQIEMEMEMKKQENHEARWAGKARAKLGGASAEQVWPLLQDFCNFHLWLPSVDTCLCVEGVSGQPDCVRHCAGTAVASNDGEPLTWVKEKLLAIDPIQRTLSYEITENNIGFVTYIATFQVLSECDDASVCMIEWSFVADPVEGWTQEGLISIVESDLQGMIKRMEEALLRPQ